MSQQITTITFFRFAHFSAKFWAFKMMQFAHKGLSDVIGQQFYKLMGSGKGLGFNPLPDWSVYSLIQTWENEEDADHFFSRSQIMKEYCDHSSETWTLYMRNIKAHGAWSGNNPFEKNDQLDENNPLIAVITRATIKPGKLRQFWSYVPHSQKPLEKNEGLIYTKGIGEVPVIQMATFSLWNDEAAIKKFAYQSREHQKAIEKTRNIKWYKEELFARFQPFKSSGQWSEIDLKTLFPTDAKVF